MPRFSLLVVASLAAAACTNPTEPDLPTLGRRLSVGETSVCMLAVDAGIHCWGSNFNREFADSSKVPVGAFAGAGVPTAVTVSMPKVLSLSAGWGQHRCGITEAGAGVCWGRAGSGQLGDGQVGPLTGGNPTVAVSGTTKWSDIRVGRLTTCGVDSANDAWCWGLNQRGELGDSTLSAYPDPAERVVLPNKVVGGIKFSQVVPGWIHTCGISTAGTAYCWGSNNYGELGIGIEDSLSHKVPLPVSGTHQFKSLSLGSRSTCGITTTNQLMCWGFNMTGQLGVGDTLSRNVPTAVAGTLKFTQVALGSGFYEGVRPQITRPNNFQAGIAHGCALSDTEVAYCWGWNGAGQVGDGTTTNRLTPVAVTGGLKFTTLASGGAYTCGMTALVDIYCWGSNYYGQLGEGTFLDKQTPVKVQTPP